MRHIVLWSGGIDSTNCLINILTNTNDEVIALHMNGDLPLIPMDPNIIKGERDAIHSMLPILRNRYREFEYKEFSHQRFLFDEDDHAGYEVTTFPLIYMLDGTPTVVYLSKNQEEMGEFSELFHSELSNAIKKDRELQSALYQYSTIEFKIYNKEKPKAQVYQELGELTEYTWSCIGPCKEEGKQCGECIWCVQIEKIRQQALQGDQVQ